MIEKLQKQAVVIWENDAVRHNTRRVEQEATVSSWTVGPTERPATVRIVSSGFETKQQRSPQAAPSAMLGMRLAA
ncbi:hypothetical protein NDK47_02725 [Brevibacillus ruminantium]|uniref:Uncharacterized protein n=1 Tax=Brevibacillus ruminantium TaxID=2950604 RepID=A0ABY4WGI4_9BACL|nr:hypothetical protein [Brevibacillus ruminantium]USG66268.1 hypothetical protein NDK47_02725 [Brevibacillus ruminantium]